jgi:hypothetical protein
LLAGGMVGYGNKIYCSYFTFGYNKGFGVFEGTIARNTNTNTTWRDFTNNMEFPRIRRFQINKNSNNAVLLYAAMQGTGFEKRDITPTAPVAVQQIVEEPTAENLRISVFPNPTSEMVEVEIPTTEKEDASYQVYSLQGRPFLSGKFNGNKVNLNISNLPTGIYQIRVIYADRVDTKQISVVR